jgi:chromate reductase
VKLAPPEFSLGQLQISDLPLYNQDDDAPTEPVRRLKAEITESDSILFVTLEYNRSMPDVLKNALDHASRPLRSECLGGQTDGSDWRFPGLHWDSACGTASTQLARIPRHAHSGS